ncbi:F-box/kelch-repeat protein At1g80440-like [Cryptomeria japonica]|uniref:F-box/kelch-repeat protein At1g80440-like n=1 Tax=Cryptomeria japonica TaxID=3369 RepID=UPI0027DA36CD|nr:F-box/kelch-repeat protein At1g80440-like [Cryptomeria japonica]
MEIIPGLPNDISRECLVRVRWPKHYKLSSVSKTWKTVVTSPLFYKNRKKFGASQELIILSVCFGYDYRIVIYDPLQKSYQILPSIPIGVGIQNTYFAHCVSLNQKLVVMGFHDREELLFVYDFCSGRWKRGADLPDRRYLFGCSVDSAKGLIYIAGGRDENDNQILFTAAVYNVEKDEWEYLPPMIWGGNFSSQSAFADNKLYVINPHSDEGFVQCYDPNTRLWRNMSRFHDFIDRSFKYGIINSVLPAFGRLFYVCNENVIEFDYVENQFQLAGTRCPSYFSVVAMTMWHSQIVICGRTESGGTAFYLFEPCTVGENGQAGKPEKWTLLTHWTLVDLTVVNCCRTLTL